METYEAKCKALLDDGRNQKGEWSEKKDCELSFYRRMYHYYKKYFNSLFNQAILDQQQILNELKEVKDSLILERKHNQRLKEQIEILKGSKNEKTRS